MITIAILTDGGLYYEGPSLSPSEIKVFIEMAKDSGIWVDGSRYEYAASNYNADDMTYDILVQ